MIVKIWPVRGTEGVKNTLLYVQDDNKVVEIERTEDGIVTRRTIIDTHMESGVDARQYFIENETDIGRVMEYVANENKIKSRFISGYLCDPEKAEYDFYCAKCITCEHADKALKDGDNDIVAFHIVQSFPEDLDISDEEVHQCGIELVERLSQYQAVIASHVHPVYDEEGEVHGRCKHNHIVINAYIHPEKMDPKNLDRIHYHSGQQEYRMLRFWNDEIAMEHGLPIIRNPDMDKKYSWYEAEVDKKKTSWKGRVRLDIDEARRVTGSWEEFAAVMEHNGYKVLERGQTVTFLAPDGQHRVRGKTLGRPYSKEGLEAYWVIREQTEREVREAVDINRNIRVDEMVRAKKGLAVAVPIGNEGLEEIMVHHLSLDRNDLSNKALCTYFRKKDHYDICDADGNMIAAASGAEIIEYFKAIRDGQKDQQKDEEPGRDPDDWKNTDEYYYNENFRNSQTKEHYKVPKKDKNGEQISPLRLIFILACVILKKEDGRWKAKKVPHDKANDPIYAKTDWKIQNMMDAIAVAREEGLNTPADIDEKLQIVGATYSRIRASLKRTQASKEAMDPLAKAVRDYKQYAEIAKKILAMPEGEARTIAEQEHAAELAAFKESRAFLYKHNITNQKQLADFETRYESVIDNLEQLQEKFDESKESYRRLKKLQYNTELAQNAQYVYGPSYDPQRTVGGNAAGGGTGRKQNEKERENGTF